jgi:hypothetical protein
MSSVTATASATASATAMPAFAAIIAAAAAPAVATSAVATSAVATSAVANTTHLRLLSVDDYLKYINKHDLKNEPRELECAICYKQITNTFFVCDDPCTKTFHPSCMEKSIEQTVDAAYEEDEEAEHRCCYCRRSFDLSVYILELFKRHLQTMSKNGFDVSEALEKVQKEINGDEMDEDYEYSMFELRDASNHLKKPKQAKRSEFKKLTRSNKMPRAFIKNNIGGRRR